MPIENNKPGLQTVSGDLLDVTSGIIVHQVNCRGVMGAGVAKALYKKYPIIRSKYMELCRNNNPEELLGYPQIVHVTENLTIVNLLSQLDFGNSYRNHKVYTDVDTLVKGLTYICQKFSPKQQVYIPYRIGCGLAGGNWEEVCKRIKDLPIIAVKRPTDS